MNAEEIVARGRALAGVRFRPQGRTADHGLDCVGLVAAAVGVPAARRDYALRGGPVEALERELAAAGLRRVPSHREGDVLVMLAGPEQLHLGLVVPGGLLHADARLRRVVERPGAPPWPVLSAWRLGGEAG